MSGDRMSAHVTRPGTTSRRRVTRRPRSVAGWTTTGWAVGYGGTIIKTTNGGSSWAPQTSGTTQALYSLEVISPSSAYAGGDFGVMVHTTNGGTTWTSQTTNTDATIYGLSFYSPSVGFAAGDVGTILYTNDVEVVNTFCPGSLNRNYHRILHFRKQLVIAVGKIAPRLIPLGQMAQFHREPARLNGVQPPVITFDVVVVLFCLAVIADHLHALGHLLVVGSNRSRFAAGSQKLNAAARPMVPAFFQTPSLPEKYSAP